VAIAWPIARLLEVGGEGRVIGYLMPRIENAHLIWEVYNPAARREIRPHFHHGSLLRTARNLAAVVRTLHECGYVLGDLNESNVLVTSQALVTLIDVDSFQVPGGDRLYRCRVGRPDYTPPELQGASFADVDRLPQHDAFALATLIFQLLMQGVHPFAGTSEMGGEADSLSARIAAGCWPYAWQRASMLRPSPLAPPWFVLPPSVQELFHQCFEDAHNEPDLRPTAAHWQHALEEAEHELTSCGHNPQHVFHRGLDCCPWCELVRQRGRDAFPMLGVTRPAHPQIPTTRMQPASDDGPSILVDDPLPPRAAAPAPSEEGMEMALQAIGATLERRGWLIWFGVALIGAVAGMVYALRQTLP
jgi:DNA-binding helix-hairpin-helix protein with protein kinase domain